MRTLERAAGPIDANARTLLRLEGLSEPAPPLLKRHLGFYFLGLQTSKEWVPPVVAVSQHFIDLCFLLFVNNPTLYLHRVDLVAVSHER
jgi:hypothetical protein